MEPKEIIPIPTNESQTKTQELGGDIEALFSSLPLDIKDECLEYFSSLPAQISDQIKAKLFQDGKIKENSVAAAFDKWNKEDRAMDGTYTREDIAEFDDVALELKLIGNTQDLFRRYLKSRLMKCESYEEFKSVMGDFVNSIWANRGKDKIITPEQNKIDEIDKRHSDFFKELLALEEKKKEIEQKIGNRKRIPNQLQVELSEVRIALAEMKGKRFGIDYEYMDRRGDRSEALEYDKKFKAGIYFSEYFSAEDYAVLLLETIEDYINHTSRFDRHANPELLDFTSKFFGEWAGLHQGEEALVVNGKSRSDKTERLIQRFVAGLQSYVRHKDNDSLSDSQKDSLVKELPIILRMLVKK